MTMLDPRPWSPASPHIGPDDEDLAMLAPTGDPDDDLGSAALVVHRVGAAACESVARAPLPDEYRLVEALSRARAALAGPVVDAVSKCVHAERPEVYADLLMRDVFDAGELGALSVYQACVAKGVAPPLAAQRAGLVYGVPKEELGRYLPVAADPKSHPVAIADAADRAIAKWASDVVRVESAEVVSKQTVAQTVDQYNQTITGHEHPKDAAGRFAQIAQAHRPVLTRDRPTTVTAPDAPTTNRWAGSSAGVLAQLRRNGGGGQAAPAELLEEQVVATEPAPPPTKRRVRPTRKTRATRQTRAELQAGLQSKIKSALSSRISAKLGSRLAARLQAQTQTESKFDILQPNMDQKWKADQEFGNIWGLPLSWAMKVEDARALYDLVPGGGTSVDPKVTEMGNYAVSLSELMRWQHDDHLNAMRRIADQVSGPLVPRFVRITSAELEEAGVLPTDADQVRAYAQREGYYDQLSIEADGTVNPIATAYMGLAPSADPGDEDWFLVRHPTAEALDDEVEPAEPMAAEFVVAGARYPVRGNIEGGPNSPQYELDPSQRYQIEPPIRLWKQTSTDGGHWVDRYHLRPSGDEPFSMRYVGKAVAVLDQPRTEAWRTEPRSELGRWTTGGVLAALQPEEPAEVVTTPAQVRAQRRNRKVRRTRQISTPVRSQLQANIGAELSTQMQSRLKAGLQAHLESKQAEPEQYGFPMALDDRPIHKLFSWRQWGKFLAENAPYQMADSIAPLELNGSGRSALMTKPDLDGDQVFKKLRLNIANQIDVRHGGDMIEVESLSRELPLNDHYAEMHLYQEMDNYMASHPEVAQLRIMQGKNFNHVRVYANAQPVDPQVLVYMPEDFDPDLPIRMVYLGKARREDLMRGRDQEMDYARLIDAPVNVYRAEQFIWRAEHPPRDER